MELKNKNQIIIAAAGNGKTYSIVKEALEISKKTQKNILLISYTNEGVLNLQKELKQQNNFLLKDNIEIKTWYSFLLNECIKPYQCLLNLSSKKTGQKFNIPPHYIKSMDFETNKKSNINQYCKKNIEYYINKERDLIRDKISDLVCKLNSDSEKKLLKRLEEIYSHIFIDEIQDYNGYDLSFFDILLDSNIYTKFVGDPRQATFSTNNNRKNQQSKGINITKYFEKIEKENKCSIIYCNKTRRCNKYICSFVNTIYDIKELNIMPYKENLNIDKEHIGVFLIGKENANLYWKNYEPIVLRWNKMKDIDIKDKCIIYNYGNSKGATFDRVMIYLTKPLSDFILQNKRITSEAKSKFYVACTRAKYSICIVVDNVDNINISSNSNKFKKIKSLNEIPLLQFQV